MAGLAACKSSSSCRLRRGRALRHGQAGSGGPATEGGLPAGRGSTIGAGKNQSLRLRLPVAARLAAKGGGRLQLKLDWSADGHKGHSRSGRGLSASSA